MTLAALCLLLAGCSWVGDTIKSELSAYAEPASGELAYIRLIGSRNVKVYPNSVCVSSAVQGSGYPAGPQMGGQRKRDMGMPKPAGLPKHYVEIAVRAGAPITAGFSFYSESFTPGVAGTGAPGTRSTSSCYAARTFVPEVGQFYEAVARGQGGACTIAIVRLVQDTADGPWQRDLVPSQPASRCE